MRIAVAGATGRTGRHVVTQALDRGAEVLALARRPEAVPGVSARLRVAAADALDPSSITGALAGCDAVVSALGVGTSRAPTTLYSDGLTHLLAAMARHRIGRLSVVSAAPVGPRAEQGLLERRMVMPVLDRFFGATYADMARMEALLAQSDLGWTCLRPPRLVSRTGDGGYRVSATPLPRARTLPFADLATALLDGLDRPDMQGRPCYVAT